MEHTGRIKVLDGLRALAITLVLLRHSVRAFWPDMTKPFMPIAGTDLGYLFVNGWIGVDLFFVLSGFLITHQLLPRSGHERGMDTKTYAKHRIFRIVPVYCFVLAITCLGLFPYFPYPQSYENIGYRFFYHLLFMQDYWPSDINVVFWTLAVEIKFYLLAPFFLALLMKLRSHALRMTLIIICIGLVILARIITIETTPAFSDYESYFYNLRKIFHLSIDGLLIGMLCRVALDSRKVAGLIARKEVSNALFFSGCFLVLCIALSGVMVDVGVSAFDKLIQTTLISAGFGMMLTGLLGRCSVSAVFEAKPLYWVALLSYSMYLLHLPMLFVTERLFISFVNLSVLTQQQYFILYFPVFFAITTICSAVTYGLIEKPFIRYAHRKKKMDKPAES